MPRRAVVRVNVRAEAAREAAAILRRPLDAVETAS